MRNGNGIQTYRSLLKPLSQNEKINMDLKVLLNTPCPLLSLFSVLQIHGSGEIHIKCQHVLCLGKKTIKKAVNKT